MEDLTIAVSNNESSSSINKILALAYLAIGITVGFTAGLSSAEVTLPILAALLSMVGGAAIVFMQQRSNSDRLQLALIQLAFCIGLLLALPTGILIKENRWFTLTAVARTSHEPILKSYNAETAQLAEKLCRDGNYQGLHTLLELPNPE